MKKSITFLIMFSTYLMIGQNNNDWKNKHADYPPLNELNYTVFSSDYKAVKVRAELFIRQNKWLITNQNETKSTHHYEFLVEETELARIDSFCLTLGYVSNKELNSYNSQNYLEESKLELERLEKKKEEYERMYYKVDSLKLDKLYPHWEKTRDIEDEIYATMKARSQWESVKNKYRVTLNINDEQFSPSNTRVNFVHMPGAEYVYFFTENQMQGISKANYQGVCLKYLFTKGKSYFSMGALKSAKLSESDSTTFDELFTFTFGKDYYNRHLGRGENKFMNLYIGYQVGMALANNKKVVVGIPFASPSTGIELFKNKYVLVDANVNYFLPLSDLNKNMRGWRLGAAVNFTF